MNTRRAKMMNRRALMAACVAVPVAAMSAGTASAEQTPSTGALPDGQVQGSAVSTADDGTRIFEVLDAEGNVVGYTVDAGKRQELEAAAGDFQAQAQELDGEQVQAASVTNVALCVAAVGWFIAQTVFPTVRIANLAIRLGGLVSKYGVSTVARILAGARGIAGRTAEQEIKEFALAASGIGGLAACGI